MTNPGPKLVLLVDDEENFLEIARMLLEGEDDLVVVTARDGRSALRLLEVVEPDVVLTDMMMPVLDGFGLISEYKRRPNARPVIAASSLVPYLARAEAAGADATLVKPFNATTLIGTVRKVLAAEPVPAIASSPDLQAEQRRLQAILDASLDQPSPEFLQRYVEQIGAYFEVPMALFSVVTEDRQFWAAGCGIPEDLAEVRGTPRQDSFCTHAVAARAALVVQDTHENPFFRDNILVETRGLRFYAGVPLFARHGEALGTLCILDFQPRSFTHSDLELLSVFGRGVLATIEERERQKSPHIPRSAFCNLDYIDRDLDIFGASAFRDLAVVEAARGLEGDASVICCVLAVPARRLRETVDALLSRFERTLLGRLGHSRLGWLVPGSSKLEVEAAAREIAGAHGFVKAVDLGGYVGAVPAVVSQIEESLGDAGLA